MNCLYHLCRLANHLLENLLYSLNSRYRWAVQANINVAGGGDEATGLSLVASGSENGGGVLPR